MTNRALLLAASTALFFPLAANAAEPEQIAASIKAVFANEGATIGWASVSGDDSEIVLEGVTAEAQGQPEKLNVGTVRLEDISEVEGRYRIGTMTFQDYSGVQQGFTLSATGMTVSGLQVPMNPTAQDTASLLEYEGADLESFTVKQGETSLFALDGFNVSIEAPDDKAAPIAFSSSIDEIKVELANMLTGMSKSQVEEMGYGSLSGALVAAGSYERSTGRVRLDDQTLEFADVGSLGMSFDLSGYTPQVIQQLRVISQDQSQDPQRQATQQAAMMTIMQGITLNSASIRFDDDSLTGKLLERTSQMGVAPTQIVPLAVAQLGLPPSLTASVSQALILFLNDPQSLEIKAAPATGVPLVQPDATSADQIVQRFNISITANED